MYRANPDDKHMFVCAMKKSGGSCAVTGEGINDAKALSEANVGFCMGIKGCAVAKDNSDILILAENFSSVKSAARWGRNIFENCRKFIQFQMTINVTCLAFVILAGATLGKSPFTVIQLLWINLIMDVLAAIALATEAPHPTQLRKERVKKSDKIVTPIMWRSISAQVIYQLVSMIVLLYATPAMFDMRYNMF